MTAATGDADSKPLPLPPCLARHNTLVPNLSSPEIVAALSGAAPPEPKPEPASSNGSATAASKVASVGGTAAEEALLALRRAALTGALEKTPPPGSTVTAGQAEAQKEEFWRGHVKVRNEGRRNRKSALIILW